MVHRLLGLAAPLLLGGCSLIYNPDNLPSPRQEAGVDTGPDSPKPDARPDAPADAEVVLDSNGALLALSDVAPPTIFEGQGVGGSRPALVVIHGSQILADATVEITADTGTANLVVAAPQISGDGEYMLVPIVASLDAALHDGTELALTIKVTQVVPGVAAPVIATLGGLKLHGLDQLDGTAPAAAQLLPLYAEVNLTSAATFTGTQRVTIHSTSSITVGVVSGNAVGGTPGPAGCAGGAAGAAGQCEGGGGGVAASNSGGGGGAGYAVAGAIGAGTGGGAPGASFGDPLIATYDGFTGHAANHGSGGGGGNKGCWRRARPARVAPAVARSS